MIDAAWMQAHDPPRICKDRFLVPTRRMFLALLLGAVLSAPSGIGAAKDGGDDGGGDNSGHGGGDDHGDDNSGHGSDDDDHGKKRDDDEWSQDRVLRERELGRVIPLKTALRIIAARIRGRVIDVDLLSRGGKPQYRVKIRRIDGVIQIVRLDARTGQIIGFLGL